MIPLAPGDAADIAARALGEEIAKLLKTSVLAVNRPGAGGAVGAGSVVLAKKYGHTVLFAQNSALTFRAALDPQSAAYDALRDLVPLGTSSRTPAEDARKALVGAIEQAVKAPAITARLAPLGILQSYAPPEQTAGEMRAELKRVSEMAKETGLIK